MRIAMFVYNRCTNDQRVLKSAASLHAAGHEIVIVAVRDQTTSATEERDGVRIVRIERDPIHYKLLRGGRSARRQARLSAARGRRAVRRGSRRVRWAGRVARRIYVRTRARLRGDDPDQALASALARADAHRRPPSGLVALAAPFAALAYLAMLPRRVLLRFHKPLMYWNWYRHAFAAGRRARADAFHAHDLNTLPVAAALAATTRGKLVYDAHELYPEVSTLSERERRVWRRLERRLAPRADAVVTVCDSIAGELQKRYPLRRRPLVVLNAPPAAFLSATRNGDVRTEAGLDPADDRFLMLYHGGFSRFRGLPELIDATQLLDDVVLVMIGNGAIEEELRARVAGDGLAERVRFVDPVPHAHLLSLAASADVGVIPYQAVGLNNYYSTPNKLFEYMAAGLPIASTRLPELTRFVEGLGIGVTFSDVRAEQIAEAVAQLAADPEAHGAMRKRALEASRRFVWEEEAQKLVALYEPGLMPPTA